MLFVYPFLGYVINNIDFKKIKGKYIVYLIILFVISLIVGGVCEYNYLLKNPYSYDATFLTNFTLLHAVTIFAVIKYFASRISFNQIFTNVICEVGKCTFGIYLFHLFFLYKFPTFISFWYKIGQGTIGHYFGPFIICLIVFLLSGIISFILRKIPIIKNLF